MCVALRRVRRRVCEGNCLDAVVATDGVFRLTTDRFLWIFNRRDTHPVSRPEQRQLVQLPNGHLEDPLLGRRAHDRLVLKRFHKLLSQLLWIGLLRHDDMLCIQLSLKAPFVDKRWL